MQIDGLRRSRRGPRPWRCRGQVIVLLSVLFVAFGGRATAVSLRQDEAPATVRVVHGASDLDPIDISFDDRLAILGASFLSASDPISLAAGSRRVRLAPSGEAADAPPVVAGEIELAPGGAYVLALLGTAAEPRLFLYVVDRAPLDPGGGRMRVIQGSPDIGPVDVALAGGDVLFPTVEFTGATAYADVEAADYDLQLRVADTDSVLLDLPGFTLTEGQVVDLLAVGQAADGTLQVVSLTWDAAPPPGDDWTVAWRSGSCADLGETLAEIDVFVPSLTEGASPPGTEEISAVTATLPLPFDEVSSEDRTLVVTGVGVDACGVVGQTPTATGALTVGLREPGQSGLAGVAVISPGLVDPDASDLSIFVAVRNQAAGLGEGVDGTPSAASGDDD